MDSKHGSLQQPEVDITTSNIYLKQAYLFPKRKSDSCSSGCFNQELHQNRSEGCVTMLRNNSS